MQLDTRLKKGFYLNTHVLWVDKMPMNDGNSLYSNAYTRINLKAGYRKSLSANWHLNIYGGIHNITDTHYAAMILINAPSFGGSPPRYYYPGEPRNYFGGISLSYQF
jgi:iron complex outermembrane receptor protein